MSEMIVSSAHFFDVVLIERVPSAGGALLEADGVDAGDAVQVAAERRVVGFAAEHGERALPGGDE